MNIREKLLRAMIENKVIDPDEAEIYSFGVQLLSETVISFVVFFIIAALLGMLTEYIVFMAAFAALRQYAGGSHAGTFLRCLLISCVIVMSLYLPLKFTGDGTLFIYTGSALSLPVIAVLSPVDSVYKPIADEDKKKYRKRALIILGAEVSVVIVLLICVKNSYALCVVYSWCALAVSMVAGSIQNKRLGR